jgi:hypothetical protein
MCPPPAAVGIAPCLLQTKHRQPGLPPRPWRCRPPPARPAPAPRCSQKRPGRPERGPSPRRDRQEPARGPPDRTPRSILLWITRQRRLSASSARGASPPPISDSLALNRPGRSTGRAVRNRHKRAPRARGMWSWAPGCFNSDSKVPSTSFGRASEKECRRPVVAQRRAVLAEGRGVQRRRAQLRLDSARTVAFAVSSALRTSESRPACSLRLVTFVR